MHCIYGYYEDPLKSPSTHSNLALRLAILLVVKEHLEPFSYCSFVTHLQYIDCARI